MVTLNTRRSLTGAETYWTHIVLKNEPKSFYLKVIKYGKKISGVKLEVLTIISMHW